VRTHTDRSGIVQFALKKKVHDKSLIRDTLIGFQNVMEIAQNGR